MHGCKFTETKMHGFKISKHWDNEPEDSMLKMWLNMYLSLVRIQMMSILEYLGDA